jgi:two-component system cell cycle response regulator
VRVLIAEDDLVSRRALEATLLKWGYEVVTCCDGAEAWQVLQSPESPQLAILDWMMPGMDGAQICQEVRKRKTVPYVYLVMLTAKNQREDILLGLEAGADDYLIKPLDSLELKGRLRSGRRILDLQAELISAQESLRFQATHDPLTGLWNRSGILSILDRELARAERVGSNLSVIMVDLDHFKDINDTFGHLAGDTALQETARRMRSSLRSYDEIGRYGGEEFLVVAPGSTSGDASRLAERLCGFIRENPIAVDADRIIRACASLGVASNSDCGALNADGLLRAADTALYRAKQQGRNRVEVASVADLQTVVSCVTGTPIEAPRDDLPR